MMSASKLFGKLGSAVNDGIDLAVKKSLRIRKSPSDGSKRNRADDHDVDVAGPVRLSARKRPKDECDLNLRPKRCESARKSLRCARGFKGKTAELTVYRTNGIGCIEDLPAHLPTG